MKTRKDNRNQDMGNLESWIQNRGIVTCRGPRSLPLRHHVSASFVRAV